MSGDHQNSGSGVDLPAWHIPPPVLAGVVFGAQVVLSRRSVSSKKSRIAGLVVGAGSSVLIGGAVLRFRRSDTTINPKKLATSQLVTTGPNTFTRNPMYLGTTGLLVAHALARRSWAALVPVAVYAVVMDRVQIPAEEAVLQQRFGARFERYRADTPRWV